MPLLDYKRQARLDMREVRPRVYWAALLYFAFYFVLSWLTAKLSGYAEFAKNLYALVERVNFVNPQTQEELTQMLTAAAPGLIPEVSSFSKLISVLLSLMTVLLGAGFTGYCLKVSRREETRVLDIFCSFEQFLSVLWLLLLRAILIGLLSLLLVIPGIIAAFRYSQALLLRFEHPEYTARQCLSESARLMQGRKSMLLALMLSFCLWGFLDYFAQSYIGIPIIKIYLQPFYFLTMAHFYNGLTGFTAPGSGQENAPEE